MSNPIFNRAFSMRPNSIKSSNDYINKKKAAALFANTASLNPKPGESSNYSNINYNNGVNKGICKSNEGIYNLESVGGFNVSSYDLLLNITKGRYYTATSGRLVSIPNNNNSTVDSNFVKINDCSNIELKIENTSQPSFPLNQTYNLYEGPYLIDVSNSYDQNEIKCGCHPVLLGNLEDVQIFGELTKNNNKINISSDKSLARLAEQEPLRGFKYPIKFSMSKINIK
tara:strand:+ start:2454 stop:3134 length:681 start_codon:yes stop_codon:yes gene_type:complete